jgi:hypothetical protein
VRIKKVITFSV